MEAIRNTCVLVMEFFQASFVLDDTCVPHRLDNENYLLCSVDDGYQFLVNPNDSIVSTFLRKGIYWERYMHQYLDQFADPNAACLDVGAFIGSHSVYMSKCFARVFSFEPQRKVYRQLLFNLQQNHCLNVTALNIALGNQDKLTYMSCFDEDQPENIGAVKIVDLQPDEEQTCEQVQMKRLDDVLASQGSDWRIRLIKVDVEGYEAAVFQGGRQTILKHQPVILFEEWGIWSPETLQLLTSWDYHVRQIGIADYIALPAWAIA